MKPMHPTLGTIDSRPACRGAWLHMTASGGPSRFGNAQGMHWLQEEGSVTTVDYRMLVTCDGIW